MFMDGSKVLFVLEDEEDFTCAKLQKDVSSVHVTVTRFQNGELSVRVPENVAGKDVFLLKRFLSNLHEDVFELLQCVDTLNCMSVRTLTLLLPYYPYARQDHNAYNESKGALLLAKMLTNLGVHKIITLDMHAPEQLRDFPLTVVNLTMERFWANYLRSLGYSNHEMQIMAADKSAHPRAQQIASALNCSCGYIDKQRDANGDVKITKICGFNPQKQTFLIDDLVDTGRTLIVATQSLRELSTQPISACVTHCHLSPKLLSTLPHIGLTQLITTDTLKHPTFAQSQTGFLTILEAPAMLWEGALGLIK